MSRRIAAEASCDAKVGSSDAISWDSLDVFQVQLSRRAPYGILTGHVTVIIFRPSETTYSRIDTWLAGLFSFRRLEEEPARQELRVPGWFSLPQGELQRGENGPKRHEEF